MRQIEFLQNTSNLQSPEWTNHNVSELIETTINSYTLDSLYAAWIEKNEKGW